MASSALGYYARYHCPLSDCCRYIPPTEKEVSVAHSISEASADLFIISEASADLFIRDPIERFYLKSRVCMFGFGRGWKNTVSSFIPPRMV